MTPHKFSESLSQSFAIILYFSPSISLQKEITVILKGKKKHHANYEISRVCCQW